MNLKAFHLLFVTCSALMCFLNAALYGVDYSGGNDPAALVPAALWFVGGMLLVYYGNYFLRKFRDWGYL
jgi:hypothetical protein